MEGKYYILYIGAVLFGLISCFQTAYISSGLSGILLLICSYFGIWVYDKNKIISIIQFILCGFLFYVVLGYFIFSNISSILFVVLAIVIFLEYHNEKNNSNEEAVIYKSKKIWLIPILTLIVVLLLFSSISFMDYSSSYVYSSNGISISDVSSDIKVGSNSVLGNFGGILTCDHSRSGVIIEVSFYDSDNDLLNTYYDYSLLDVFIESGDKYKFEVFYKDNVHLEKPVKARIFVHDQYKRNILFNGEISL